MRITASRWPRAVLSRLRTEVRWVSCMFSPTHRGWGLFQVLGRVHVPVPAGIGGGWGFDGGGAEVVEDDGEQPALAAFEGGGDDREDLVRVVGGVQRLGPSGRVEGDGGGVGSAADDAGQVAEEPGVGV